MKLNNKVLKIRKDIDKIDDEINSLLHKRAICIFAMRRAKGSDIPVYIPDREKEIIDRLVANNTSNLSDNVIRSIFTEIIKNFRSLEERVDT